MANQDIKTEAKEAGIYLWQIADKLHIQDTSMSKRLRKELSAEQKAEIRRIIKSIKEDA